MKNQTLENFLVGHTVAKTAVDNVGGKTFTIGSGAVSNLNTGLIIGTTTTGKSLELVDSNRPAAKEINDTAEAWQVLMKVRWFFNVRADQSLENFVRSNFIPVGNSYRGQKELTLPTLKVGLEQFKNDMEQMDNVKRDPSDPFKEPYEWKQEYDDTVKNGLSFYGNPARDRSDPWNYVLDPKIVATKILEASPVCVESAKPIETNAQAYDRAMKIVD